MVTKPGKLEMLKHPTFWVTTLVVAVLFVLAVALVARLFDNDEVVRTDTNTEVVEAEEPAQPLTVESNLLFTGDVFWGRRLQRQSEASELGTAFPFSGLDTLNREDYDAWITNVECPITTSEVPFSVQSNELRFNCQPKYLEEFANWFDVASLANNHTDNVGQQAGLVETREHLEEAGVQYFGHYDSRALDDICEVISIPIRVVMSDGAEEEGSLPVAMCGYHYVFRTPGAGEIDQIKTYSDRFLTIAVPHMGAEYEPTADTLKSNTFRAMVDAGADAVVGHHPHWVQNTEVYKDTLIAYSLGNFIFDQQWSEQVKRGAVLTMNMSIEYDEQLQEWLDIGKKCEKFKDSCLDLVKDLKKPKIVLTYDFIPTYNEDGVTTVAPAAKAKEILEQAAWAETSNQLKSLVPHD